MGFAEFKFGLMGSGCRQWIDDQSRQQVFQCTSAVLATDSQSAQHATVEVCL